jgi:hypothetical protein
METTHVSLLSHFSKFIVYSALRALVTVLANHCRTARIYLFFLLFFRPNVNSLVTVRFTKLNLKQWEICDSNRRSRFDFFVEIFSPFKKILFHRTILTIACPKSRDNFSQLPTFHDFQTA